MKKLTILVSLLAKTRVMFLSFVALICLGIIVSQAYFNNQKNIIATKNLTDLNPEIAGVYTQNSESLDNISIEKFLDLPTLPESEILSVDTTNDVTYLLLQSTMLDKEIDQFYSDHFLQKGWKKEGNLYTNTNKKIQIQINNSIVKITIN